ncbi:hypothetical protein H6F75_21410 [Nodosilinea sp. FACHB-131]|uniref:hypothetical protein n=1 Tax=Cyanophyceae TaxID=3028117 RepID=UPI0016881488|nr:hypothetical protein [Nodosilinea sp. FACHB-131]MBD1876044.1 hypothetical protein [Nodosilinea sp. FACHB-131]
MAAQQSAPASSLVSIQSPTQILNGMDWTSIPSGFLGSSLTAVVALAVAFIQWRSNNQLRLENKRLQKESQQHSIDLKHLEAKLAEKHEVRRAKRERVEVITTEWLKIIRDKAKSCDRVLYEKFERILHGPHIPRFYVDIFYIEDYCDLESILLPNVRNDLREAANAASQKIRLLKKNVEDLTYTDKASDDLFFPATHREIYNGRILEVLGLYANEPKEVWPKSMLKEVERINAEFDKKFSIPIADCEQKIRRITYDTDQYFINELWREIHRLRKEWDLDI